MHHHHAARQRNQQRQTNHRRGHWTLGETVEAVPDTPEHTAVGFTGLILGNGNSRGFFTDAQVRQRDGNQQELGENQHGHADAGGQGQVADHRDINDHQYRKAHDVGQQRGQPGEEQAAEGVARRHVLVGAAANVLQDAVHLLGAMGNTDGENQERHQDRVRVQVVTKYLHQTQQPDHASHRHTHQQQRAAQAAGIEVDKQTGNHYRGAEEQHHRIQAVDQVTDQLAEADDMNADLVAFQRADLVFQLPGKITVVQRLAGLRIGIEQWRDNHARLAVVGHQVADNAGAHDVATQGRDRFLAAVVIRRHHRTAINALLRHLFPADDGHPQRLHPGTVDTRNQVQRVIDLLQRQQVVGVVDIAGLVFHHNANAVAQAR
ncbi:hypothetical protein D3C73_746180 [compost metagenome]